MSQSTFVRFIVYDVVGIIGYSVVGIIGFCVIRNLMRCFY
jgi:hypothetical protein